MAERITAARGFGCGDQGSGSGGMDPWQDFDRIDGTLQGCQHNELQVVVYLEALPKELEQSAQMRCGASEPFCGNLMRWRRHDAVQDRGVCFGE
ncbi:hypothetical protein [Glycomyces tritici]|uniref:Uncharacterized protein n=1 Tax=Glycomyces tritici TaxID=2665176 RepID=A0ABT7YPV6_9ACTN|nr:hypothetical protein [Glycomyces tritici]MDN3240685.1 hypothetical protein [Glycomyces tritici]